MDSKSNSNFRGINISQVVTVALIFATLLSLGMVLERHFSLTAARRDHIEMQNELDRLLSELKAAKATMTEKEQPFHAASSTENTENGATGDGGSEWLKAELESISERLKEKTEALDKCEKKLKVELAEVCNREGGSDAGASATSLSGDAEVEKLKEKLHKLQMAFDRQMEEKVKMANMMIEVEKSNKWNEKTLTPKAVEAAKKAILNCGEQYKKTFESKGGGAEVKGFGPICQATDEEISQYLNYTSRADCPDDWYFVQTLIFVKNCFCLPKRTCFARSPPNYREPLPFPRSLWDTSALIDENVRWDLHHYKSFNAINTRNLGDCRNCFNLTLEDTRWVKERHGTIALKKVAAMKKGALRIGLDAGGGSGSFAAKMAAFNCTILTTAMNIETLWDANAGLPYMETIALRGLVPLHVPHRARLPFFDNTLDIIHSMNSIKYLEYAEFEELIFEWDRVLRPGGVLWFELFYAPVTEMPLYVAVLDLFSYKKLYWNMSPKTDAPERDGEHVYLNCVLEKPRRKN